MPLIQLLYRSRSLLPADRGDDALKAILATAVRRNRDDGITGCLGYSRNAFVQVLEGQQAHVDETFLRIQQDDRHEDVQMLMSRPLRNRAFSDWSMASIDLNQGSTGYVAAFGLAPGFSIETTPPSQLLMVLMTLADRARVDA
jgi:Sensors of blue-light using FAD